MRYIEKTQHGCEEPQNLHSLHSSLDPFQHEKVQYISRRIF